MYYFICGAVGAVIGAIVVLLFKGGMRAFGVVTPGLGQECCGVDYVRVTGTLEPTADEVAVAAYAKVYQSTASPPDHPPIGDPGLVMQAFTGTGDQDYLLQPPHNGILDGKVAVWGRFQSDTKGVHTFDCGGSTKDCTTTVPPSTSTTSPPTSTTSPPTSTTSPPTSTTMPLEG